MRPKVKIRRTDNEYFIQYMHRICFPSDAMIEPDPDRAMWIGTYDGDCLACFCTARKLEEENTVFLERAGVFPSLGGLGLQRKMIHMRIAWARSIGADSVVTYTTYQNHLSIANLIRAGMKFYTPAYFWAGKNVHYYRMEL